MVSEEKTLMSFKQQNKHNLRNQYKSTEQKTHRKTNIHVCLKGHGHEAAIQI